MTEIKLRRTPHSLPRRSNSPRRNDLSRRSQTQAEVKTGAKTGALPIPHLNGSFPVFSLGWTIGAIGFNAKNEANFVLHKMVSLTACVCVSEAF